MSDRSPNIFPALRYRDATAAIEWLVDGHHDRAAKAGAEVVRKLRDEDYGGRGYSVRDSEGNVWTFGSYYPSR